MLRDVLRILSCLFMGTKQISNYDTFESLLGELLLVTQYNSKPEQPRYHIERSILVVFKTTANLIFFYLDGQIKERGCSTKQNICDDLDASETACKENSKSKGSLHNAMSMSNEEEIMSFLPS